MIYNFINDPTAIETATILFHKLGAMQLEMDIKIATGESPRDEKKVEAIATSKEFALSIIDGLRKAEVENIRKPEPLPLLPTRKQPTKLKWWQKLDVFFFNADYSEYYSEDDEIPMEENGGLSDDTTKKTISER